MNTISFIKPNFVICCSLYLAFHILVEWQKQSDWYRNVYEMADHIRVKYVQTLKLFGTLGLLVCEGMVMMVAPEETVVVQEEVMTVKI